MIGKSEQPKWKYDFKCRDCENMQYVKDEIRNGWYCVLLMNLHDPIHADDDNVVRCDEYKPMQMQMQMEL